MATTFVCGDPKHEGSRRQNGVGYTVSLDVMLADGTQRLYRIKGPDLGMPDRICRTCADRMEAEIRPGKHQLEGQQSWV